MGLNLIRSKALVASICPLWVGESWLLASSFHYNLAAPGSCQGEMSSSTGLWSCSRMSPLRGGRPDCSSQGVAWPVPSSSTGPCVVRGRRPRSSIKGAATAVNNGKTVTPENLWAGLSGAENAFLWLMRPRCQELVFYSLQNTNP